MCGSTSRSSNRGDRWQEKIERAIASAPAAVICLGAGGLRRWEEAETRALLSQAARRGARLIPLLLPGLAEPELPAFLEQFMWLDCRSGLSDESVARLVAGLREPSNGPRSRRSHGASLRRGLSSIDESLMRHVRAIERRREQAHARAQADPRSAAHLARLVVEEVALQLHLREIGPAGEAPFEQVIDALGKAGVLPSKASLALTTVLRHSTFWSHARTDTSEPTARDLNVLLPPLDEVVEWYIGKHLHLDRSQLEAPSEPLDRGPSAPPDLTPTTFTSVATSIGTRWLDGELIPIWRGRHGKHGGRIVMTMKRDQPIQPLELSIAPSRPHYVGRGELRRDKRTHNDLILNTRSVSRDQAVAEIVDGRVLLQNSSTKDNVAVGVDRLAPGACRALHHQAPVRFGTISGVFLDGRLYEAAPESTVDMATGLLSRDGLTCEIALALVGRRNRHLFIARYAPDDEPAAIEAALLLHQREPELAVARIGHLAALLCSDPEGMDERLEALRAAELGPRLSGQLPLAGESTCANAIIEAAASALCRLAAAGAGHQRVIDLARYAIASASLPSLVAHAADAYAAGGGVVLFALEEMERLIELEHPARTAVELEFREMLGAALGPADAMAAVDEGLLAVLTYDAAELLAREQPERWRARGPVQVGHIELDRCARALPLPPESVDALVTGGAAFVREAMKGVAVQLLPSPIAYPLDRAARATDAAERVRATLTALEQCWRLVAAVMAAAHRQRFRDQPLNPNDARGWAQPWTGLATRAAEPLLEPDGRIADLANAVRALAADGTLDAASAAAAQAQAVLQLAGACPESLDTAEQALRAVLNTTLTSLRTLRGWSLVAVRATRALDIHGRVQRIDYTDFSGPHASGVSQHISVTGLPVHEFVYLARWAEGLMVVLDPWVRRARNPQSGTDELFLIEAWPTAPGHHPYRAASGDARIQLEVTGRHLR